MQALCYTSSLACGMFMIDLSSALITAPLLLEPYLRMGTMHISIKLFLKNLKISSSLPMPSKRITSRISFTDAMKHTRQ